jgi:hypothetical protein
MRFGFNAAPHQAFIYLFVFSSPFEEAALRRIAAGFLRTRFPLLDLHPSNRAER